MCAPSWRPDGTRRERAPSGSSAELPPIRPRRFPPAGNRTVACRRGCARRGTPLRCPVGDREALSPHCDSGRDILGAGAARRARAVGAVPRTRAFVRLRSRPDSGGGASVGGGRSPDATVLPTPQWRGVPTCHAGRWCAGDRAPRARRPRRRCLVRAGAGLAAGAAVGGAPRWRPAGALASIGTCQRLPRDDRLPTPKHPAHRRVRRVHRASASAARPLSGAPGGGRARRACGGGATHGCRTPRAGATAPQ